MTDYKVVKLMRNWVEYCMPKSWIDWAAWIIDLLVVGWGWHWWMWYYTSGWGWWGWWVIYRENVALRSSINSVKVWAWWENSCFWSCVAYAWWTWWTWNTYGQTWWCWWSWWWAWWTCFVSMNACCRNFQWLNYADQWKPWKMAQQDYYWWGWGWAWETTIYWTVWWDWFTTDISWASCTYAWWWTGWRCTSAWWAGWGWKGAGCWTYAAWDWTYYWWGWGGWYYCSTNCCWWRWYQWIVILRYKTDWSSWINPDCALWWCKYCCWDYTIHCFDSVWNNYFFTSVPKSLCPWVYHNPNSWIITLYKDSENMITLCDKNEWATTTDTSSDCSYWYYYQWGNNYWFPTTWSMTTSSTNVDASNYWPWNYYCCWTFIKCGTWDTSKNNNLWWWTTDTYAARQWMMASWYHIPSRADIVCLGNILCYINWWSYVTQDQLKQYIYFPESWYRTYSGWYICCAWVNWQWGIWTSDTCIYWSSTYWHVFFVCCTSDTEATYKWFWIPIRWFKNVPTTPDWSWNPIFIKQD